MLLCILVKGAMKYICMNIVMVLHSFLLAYLQLPNAHNLIDIRKVQLVAGRSINLALSARGRKALTEVGLEDVLLDHGIPMRGRMLHDIKGHTTFVPYDRNTKQVNIRIEVSIHFRLLHW